MKQLHDQDDVQAIVNACKAWAYAVQLKSQTAMDEAEILVDAEMTKALSGPVVDEDIIIDHMELIDGNVEMAVTGDTFMYRVVVNMVARTVHYEDI